MAVASLSHAAGALRPSLRAACLAEDERAIGCDPERRYRCLWGQGWLPRLQVGWREAAKSEGQPLPWLLSLQRREPGSEEWISRAEALSHTSPVYSKPCLPNCKLLTANFLSRVARVRLTEQPLRS